MILLAPIAGLIGLALTLPVLLLLYFLRLRRRPVRVTSTLLWTRAVADLQVNAPFQRLRTSLLLLLHLLMLGGLIAALARPAILEEGEASPRVVILIDRSASMAATDGVPATDDRVPMTRSEQGRREAELIATRIARTSGTQGMVIGMAARPAVLCSFTGSASDLKEAIAAATPTDQQADLAAALQLVDSLRAGDTNEQESGQALTVYVVSDGGFAPGQSLPESATGINGPTTYVRVPVGPALPDAASDNLGIVALNASRDFDDPAMVRLFVRILSARPEPQQASLQLLIDGQAAQVRNLTLAAHAPGAPFGETTATFDLETTSQTLITVRLDRKDLLASDNTASLLLAQTGRPAVLVVGPSETAPDFGADEFLLSALEQMDLDPLRVVSAGMFARMGTDEIRAADLIVLDRVRPALLPGAPTLSIGATLPIAGLGVVPMVALAPSANATEEPPLATTPATNPGGTRFLAWRRTHPLLRYVALDPIVIAPPMIMTLPANDAVDPSEHVSAEAIATGRTGPLIAVLQTGRMRRVVLGFELSRTNWGPEASFPVFLANCVEYLTLSGAASAGRSYRTVDPIEITATEGAAEVRIYEPHGAELTVAPVSESGIAAVGVLDRVGTYTAQGAASGFEVLPVNLEQECETSLRSWPNPETRSAAEGAVPGRNSPAGVKAPVEIWRWFVIGVALLSIIEWSVYALRMRL